jgi:hypothetical protein
MAVSAAVMMLPWLFKQDKPEYMYTTNGQQPKSKMPTIVFLRSLGGTQAPPCRIILGNVEVMAATDGQLNFIEVWSCLCPVYYVYNVQYHKHALCTMSFLQATCMGKPVTNMPTAVRNIVNVLFKK